MCTFAICSVGVLTTSLILGVRRLGEKVITDQILKKNAKKCKNPTFKGVFQSLFFYYMHKQGKKSCIYFSW